MFFCDDSDAVSRWLVACDQLAQDMVQGVQGKAGAYGFSGLVGGVQYQMGDGSGCLLLLQGLGGCSIQAVGVVCCCPGQLCFCSIGQAQAQVLDASDAGGFVVEGDAERVCGMCLVAGIVDVEVVMLLYDGLFWCGEPGFRAARVDQGRFRFHADVDRWVGDSLAWSDGNVFCGVFCGAAHEAPDNVIGGFGQC
ncbi:MAG: hypothetical protein AAFO09_01975 [Pseudomonadota bacterium]